MSALLWTGLALFVLVSLIVGLSVGKVIVWQNPWKKDSAEPAPAEAPAGDDPVQEGFEPMRRSPRSMRDGYRSMF